ncbi:MAG: hypothetical protein FWF63_09525 [Fibromonadales bacterium]|nr:hypothetical protein [Fibromonadales bacterium]
MKKQICFLVLLLMLAAPCQEQMSLAVLEPNGKEPSEDEQKILSLIAAVSSINTGESIRNDIVWRKKWVEHLKETEKTFYKIINSAPPPYTLYYSTVIETGKIDYQKETADLSISISLVANSEWFSALQRSLKAAQAVMDGLNATTRKKDWGLDDWPEQGVSETNPFAAEKKSLIGGYRYIYSSKKYDIPVEFELVNQRGRAIGRQTAKLNPSFIIENFIVKFKSNESSILTFNTVKANDISDNLTIRVASVNGKPPKTARFTISSVSTTTKFPDEVLSPAAGTWTKLQIAYIIETGNIGNFAQIGYSPPEGDKNYTYSDEINNGVAYWIAKNNVTLFNKCPAGNQWIVLIKNDDDANFEVRLPKDKSCQELTPNFSKLINH